MYDPNYQQRYQPPPYAPPARPHRPVVAPVLTACALSAAAFCRLIQNDAAKHYGECELHTLGFGNCDHYSAVETVWSVALWLTLIAAIVSGITWIVQWSRRG